MNDFSHVDKDGNAQMVDVSGKKPTVRSATAAASFYAKKETIEKIRADKIRKGDVLTVAKIAAINAAKETGRLIPLCHPLALEHVEVHFSFSETAIHIECTAKTGSKTGVEMEALCGASMAALTIFDMAKAIDKTALIGDIFVKKKSGGKSGPFVHPRIQNET